MSVFMLISMVNGLTSVIMTFPCSHWIIINCNLSSRNEFCPCFWYAAHTLLAIADVILASLSWNPLKARSAPSELSNLAREKIKR